MSKNGTEGANGEPAALDLPEWTKPSWSRFLSTLSVWLAIWLLPLAALHWALGGGNVYAVEAGFFSKMAVVTFGGAYAVLAYVAQQAVDIHGWLKPDEMLTGLGLAETTPGPLILVLAFVGFLGGARLSGLDPVTGGLAGAAVALWFTFVPCFLWIFVGAPYVETVRNIRWLASALAAVTAAVVGIIANLTVWFGLHVLFGSVGEWQIGIFSLPVPDLATLDFAAAAIAIAAGVALIRYQCEHDRGDRRGGTGRCCLGFGLKSDAADGGRAGLAVEAGDDGPRLGDRRLDFGQGERGLVARLVGPDLSDPDAVGIGGIGRDNVAEAAGHGAGAFQQDRYQVVALSGAARILPIKPNIAALRHFPDRC